MRYSPLARTVLAKIEAHERRRRNRRERAAEVAALVLFLGFLAAALYAGFAE